MFLLFAKKKKMLPHFQISHYNFFEPSQEFVSSLTNGKFSLVSSIILTPYTLPILWLGFSPLYNWDPLNIQSSFFTYLPLSIFFNILRNIQL